MTAARVLTPLWSLCSGVAVAAVLTTAMELRAGPFFSFLLMALGALAIILALQAMPRRLMVLWIFAGLALGGGRGLQQQEARQSSQQLLAPFADAAIRARVTITEGWSASRWGQRSRVTLHQAHHDGRELKLRRRCAIEVRGRCNSDDLPAAGSTIEVLARVRGESRRPLLVLSSSRLVEPLRPPHGIAGLRDTLATRLLNAAGTRVERLRTAELAAALCLGRRDLVPRSRRDGWRRSGLAHLLAVSGLHVGLIGGIAWLLLIAAGAKPPTSRLLVLIILPTYALLSGAAPSATRAAAMGMIYLLARLLGRALVPMAAVLLAAVAMVLANPELVADVGFQLTVVVTAALVRWVPTLSEAIPGPRWLSGSLAVPLVAQAAAVPIIVCHFRTLVPGAVITNLIVIPLLAPLLVIAVAATAAATVWPSAAAWLLSLMNLLHDLLWFCGGLARAMEVITPPLPVLVIVVLVAAGCTALLPLRLARAGATLWLVTILLTGAWWILRPGPRDEQVTLLPVSDGAAVLVTDSTGTAVLVDTGHSTRQASELLAELGVHHLHAVLASHSDEDHVGGLISVLNTSRVDLLAIPRWMQSSEEAAPLLVQARRRNIRVLPVVRGSYFTANEVGVEVLWPPSRDLPAEENNRSLVARLRLEHGRILITSDIDRSVEALLAGRSNLATEVLVVPHHGSSRSTSMEWLDACHPVVALIPAGPHNLHNHPSRQVLTRLRSRAIPYRAPAHHGWCGATWRDGAWRPFP